MTHSTGGRNGHTSSAHFSWRDTPRCHRLCCAWPKFCAMNSQDQRKHRSNWTTWWGQTVISKLQEFKKSKVISFWNKMNTKLIVLLSTIGNQSKFNLTILCFCSRWVKLSIKRESTMRQSSSTPKRSLKTLKTHQLCLNLDGLTLELVRKRKVLCKWRGPLVVVTLIFTIKSSLQKCLWGKTIRLSGKKLLRSSSEHSNQHLHALKRWLYWEELLKEWKSLEKPKRSIKKQSLYLIAKMSARSSTSAYF